jgi:ATP-dependent exoDNAse (exonuclease V) alpha subunit
LKNDKRLHVKNGETGTIKDIGEKGSFFVKTDSGKTVDFNVKDYNFIGHAYAVTA